MAGESTKRFDHNIHTGGIRRDAVRLHQERLAATNKGKRQFVLGLDIGGQTIKPELYEVVDGVLSAESVMTLDSNPKTLKGIDAHKNQIAEIIMQAKHYAEEGKGLNGKLVGVGIGAPGRLTSDGIVKPGSFPNLRLTADEFDGKNLKQEYIGAIRDWDAPLADEMKKSLSVANDAKAMFMGMFDAAIQQKPAAAPILVDLEGNRISPKDLGGKRVALFGIGTGLGHCIADIDPNGTISQFVTDGHGSELLIKVDKGEDEAFLLKAIDRVNEAHKQKGGEDLNIPIFDLDGHKAVRAEFLMCDPMLKAMCNVTDAKDITIDGSNDEHQKVIAFAGKYMARLIETIQQKKGYDISDHLRDIGENSSPKSSWSDAEKEDASKTNVYLLGSGVGSKPLGRVIAQIAKEKLESDGVRNVMFAQFVGNDNPAPRAAASLVKFSDYRQIGPA